MMQFVPWRNIANWQCSGCGSCCKLYSVVINFSEWLKITEAYGAYSTVSGPNDFYIRRQNDGSCSFLQNNYGNYCCALQNMKPQACKLWPFRVLSYPRYGEENQASYVYGGAKIYIYADTKCNGLKYGSPTWDFLNITIKELAEIALGIRNEQHKTTRAQSPSPQSWGRQLRFP